MGLVDLVIAPDRFLSEQHKKAVDYMHEHFGWTKYECQKIYLGLRVLAYTGIGAPTALDKYNATGEMTFGSLEYLCTAAIVVDCLNILHKGSEIKRREYLKAFEGETRHKNSHTKAHSITHLGSMLREMGLAYSSVGLYYGYKMIMASPSDNFFAALHQKIHNADPALVSESQTMFGLQIASAMVLTASLVLLTYFREAPMHSPYQKKPFFETAYDLLHNMYKRK